MTTGGQVLLSRTVDDKDEITEVVAIDGPAGAGKSTVARRVAGALGYAFLDTGAMYRAATWRAVDRGVALDDAAALAESTRAMRFTVQETDGERRVWVDEQDVTEAIRTPSVTRAVHHLDHNPEVRASLVRLQRAVAAEKPTVAEGRDMGTVVFPKARCKIYLDASIEERTRRRAEELEAKGVEVNRAALREEIQRRDEKDMGRALSPLRQAPDAVRIDTTGMTIEETVAAILNLARRRSGFPRRRWSMQ